MLEGWTRPGSYGSMTIRPAASSALMVRSDKTTATGSLVVSARP